MKTLRSYLGDLRQNVLRRMYRRSAPLGNNGPLVSFTFDDFPRSAALVGGRILQDFGVRGTYYVSYGLMDRENELGELFHQEDLFHVMEQGHELGTHTFSHGSARKLSLSEFRDDANKGLIWLEKQIGRPTPNFCYPYGEITLGTKKILGSTFASLRSIVPGLNGADVDLNMLRANSIYGGLDQADRFKALIRENLRQGSWLIFYTHDIRPNASEYGCTPELFEMVVTEAIASGSKILTVGQVLSRLRCKTAAETRAVSEPVAS